MINSKTTVATGDPRRHVQQVQAVGEESETEASAHDMCPCESSYCWSRHQKENEASSDKFKRLSVIMILLLFLYLYVADSEETLGKSGYTYNLLPQLGLRHTEGSSPSTRQRERRSVVDMDNNRATILSKLKEHMVITESENCTLQMNDTSIDFNNLRRKPIRMIYFQLQFSASINVTVSEHAYLPYRWVWTYSGRDNSSDRMLEYPFDYGLLSFGILTRFAYRTQPGSQKEFIIKLHYKNSCNKPLYLGTAGAAMKIRDALINRTDKAFRRHSQFCFESVVDRTSRSQLWWYATHIVAIAKDYTYFNCCVAQAGLLCNSQHHQTYYMWLVLAWSLTIVCFSPLFLHFIPDHKRKRIKDNRGAFFDSFSSEESTSLIDVGLESPDIRQEKWIYLGQNPMSVKPILRKIMCLNKSNRLIRRIWRVVIVLLSLCILIIKVMVYYFKEHENVHERLRLDIPVGELCIPYGYDRCLQNTEYFLGGPFVYIPLFVILASTLLCVPDSIPNVFLDTKELQDDANFPVISFLYLTDGILETRGITQRQLMISGYGCLAAKIKERFFMIFCVRFWKSFFAVWFWRLQRVNLIRVGYFQCGPSRQARILGGGFALVPTVLAWILLMGVCVIEAVLVILYYGIPLIFFVKLAISGLMSLMLDGLFLSTEHGTRMSYKRLVSGVIVSVIVLIAMLFVITVAILNFVHSFLFLVNILTFTFAGLVVYPEFSATYSIAAIAVVYYLFRSVRGFTEGYIRLLQHVVHVSDSLQRSRWRPYGYRVEADEYRPCFVKKHRDTLTLGVPRATFDYVARMVHPIRVQVAIVFLKLLITANVIYSTVMLTQTFHNGYNGNLTTRTMSVIFVGLMPEVFGVFSSRVRRIIDEEIFEKKVENWVKAYWQEHLKLNSYEAVP